MKKIIIFLVAIAALTACNNTAETKSNKGLEAQANVEYVALKDLQENGADFLDKEIQTKGIVDHVCRHSGKKILLVADDVSVHVMAEERYDANLVGKEILINAIVKEDRTDESTLLKIEEDAINSHKHSDEEEKVDEETEEEIAAVEARQERIIAYVNTMRDSLKNANKEYFSEYYLEYISYEEVK